MADHYPQDRREWLLQIGQRLRLEYADIIAAAPLPERLAALLKQLEEAAENPRPSSLKTLTSASTIGAAGAPGATSHAGHLCTEASERRHGRIER
jgi:hypothetical protein